MKKKPIFKDLAKYYDLIYSWKNYKDESDKIKSLIKKHIKSSSNELLEIACGTGKHIQYLKNDFSVLATDMNKDMLTVAKKNFPSVKFKQLNMIDFNLNKKFDVVICLFSSIAYVKNYKNLNKTIENFSKHLKKDGILIIEPWFTESAYISGLLSMTVYDGKDIKISRVCVCKKKGILSIMDMHYLIAEKNKDTQHFVEHHELAMFDIDRVLDIMKKHDLKSTFFKNGLMKDRGLYLGIKNYD